MDLLNQLSIARAKALDLEATCLPTDAVGNCVYITGPAIGDIYQVATANPLVGAVMMPAMGIIISKTSPSATSCRVRVHGEMVGVVTGLTPRKVLFVDSSGALSHSIVNPAVGQIAYIQSMGIALSTDRVLVVPDFSITKRIG